MYQIGGGSDPSPLPAQALNGSRGLLDTAVLLGRVHRPGPFVLRTPSPPVRPPPVRPSPCIALCHYCHPRGSSPLSLYAPTGPPTRPPPSPPTHSTDDFAVFAFLPPISAPLSAPCPVSSFFPSLHPSAALSVFTSFLLLVVGGGHILAPVAPWSAPPPPHPPPHRPHCRFGDLRAHRPLPMRSGRRNVGGGRWQSAAGGEGGWQQRRPGSRCKERERRRW